MKRTAADHPKIKQLASLLNINEAWAVGILELLWHFTAKYAPQGDIGKYPDDIIARAVRWEKHTGRRGVTPEYWLSSSLVEAELVDCCDCHRLVVHDWAEHADQQVKRKLASQKLVFAHPLLRPNLAKPEPEPEPEPEPTSTEGVLNSPGEFHTAAQAAAAAGLPARLGLENNEAAANGNDVERAAWIELEREGCPLPQRYITNEYGKYERNPASVRIEAALSHARPRIHAARMPVAFAKKVILDALKGA